MSDSIAQLSKVLADVATAVVATQQELDRLAVASPNDLPLAPLAFVVRQTDVTLQGTFAMRGGVPVARDGALAFALVDRVQASLRVGDAAALSTRISVSIQAIETPHGRQA